MHKIKVVAIIKGEFQSKVIDAEGANGKTISVMFTFDRNTDIGKIQEGDEYFTCVWANQLIHQKERNVRKGILNHLMNQMS